MQSLMRRLLRAQALLPGNHLRLLDSGAEFFPALIAAIDAAQSDIHVETYIFQPDASGLAVLTALTLAARRGVKVQLLIDGVGSRGVAPAVFAEFVAAGGALLHYRPLRTGGLLRPTNLRRLHRKIAVIDARVAFIGGINLVDDHAPTRPGVAPYARPRLDFAVRVEGPLLSRIHPDVAALWRRVAFAQWQSRLASTHPPRASWPTDGHSHAAFVTRDNLANRHAIERNYRTALALAQSSVDIACAYFLPGQRFRRLLKSAAGRGVRVRLLMQGTTDHPFYQHASEALYADLLTAGVAIHLYTASELHAKVAVIDGRWATVGSSNIDPFSLLLAREANLVTDDPAFCEALRARLDHAIVDDAVALDPARWAQRGLLTRLASWLAYASVRWLAGLLGRGRSQ